MTGMELLTGFLIGAIAGILSGLAGVGGGVVMIPLLTYFSNYPHHTAQGTTLFVFSLPVLAGSAYTYYRKGRVDFLLAVSIALGVLASGFFIAQSVQKLRGDTLARIFFGFLIAIGLYLIFREKLLKGAKTPDSYPLPWHRKALWGVTIGILSGMLSGLTGLGGGIMIVPLIRLLLRYEQHTAQGTSLATLSIPVLIGAMWPYYQNGHVKVEMGLALAAGLFVMSILTGNWAQKLRGRVLELFFGVLIAVIGLIGLLR